MVAVRERERFELGDCIEEREKSKNPRNWRNALYIY